MSQRWEAYRIRRGPREKPNGQRRYLVIKEWSE